MSDMGTRLKKGDIVRVITGKDKGKEGKILGAIAPVEKKPKSRPSRLLVEGINIVIKHKRPRPQANVNPAAQREQSGRVETEAAVYASKVMLVCPHCAKPTRIGMQIDDKCRRFRACKQCDKQID